MAEDLTKKKRIRKGHRTSVTKFIHQVETILAGDRDISRLSVLKMMLTEKTKTLSVLDEEIVSLLEDEGALADDIEQIASSASLQTSSAAEPLPTDAASRVRLPKLTIRQFDGDITKWTSFWDSYESAIHKNPAYQKLTSSTISDPSWSELQGMPFLA